MFMSIPIAFDQSMLVKTTSKLLKNLSLIHQKGKIKKELNSMSDIPVIFLYVTNILHQILKRKFYVHYHYKINIAG